MSHNQRLIIIIIIYVVGCISCSVIGFNSGWNNGNMVGYEEGVSETIKRVNQLNDSTWLDQNIIILLSETDTTLVYSVSN